MAIVIQKYRSNIQKIIRKPSILCIIFLILSIAKDFSNHELHTRELKSNIVKVVDGDTIILSDIKIRLQGIDAPELYQSCREKKSGNVWKCGIKAKEYLKELIAEREVSCTKEGIDKYKRQLSYCYAGDTNLNRAMVRNGYASSYTKFDALFFVDEIFAKIEEKGMWNSFVEDPERWRIRKRNIKGTYAILRLK